MNIFALTALIGLFAFSGTPAPLEDLPAQADTPSFSVKLTAYNAVAAQTDGDPHITASGAFSNPEVVAARSRDLAGILPFGTIIAIEGPATPDNDCGYDLVASKIGYRVIADSMHSRKRSQVDILLDHAERVRAAGKTVDPAVALGICESASIRVVGFVNIKNMPKTQGELARLVEGEKVATR